MTERRLPSRSHDIGQPPVGHRAVGDDDPVVGRRGDGPGQPEPGHAGAERGPPVGQHLRRAVAVGRDGRRRRPRRGRPRRCWPGPARRARSAAAWRRCASSSSAAMRAWAASASAWTQAIEDPGMMSWNCCVSTSCHSPSSSCGSPSPATVIHSSASRSSRSQRRLPTFVRSWLVSVPRWVSKYSSPRHTGTGAPRADLGLDGVEEVGRRARLDVRHPVEVADAAQPLEHLAGRPAAAVAVAERHQRPPRSTRARRSARRSRRSRPA